MDYFSDFSNAFAAFAREIEPAALTASAQAAVPEPPRPFWSRWRSLTFAMPQNKKQAAFA